MGVSDLIGTILIIILVIGLAAVIAAFLMPNLLHKSAYIAGAAAASPITPLSGLPVEVITFLPQAGDPFYIIGQKQSAGGYPISVKALSPDGRKINVSCIDLTGNLYGKTLYLYPLNTPGASPCEMCLRDSAPTGSLVPMTNGRWTIQLVDEDAHFLVMSNSDGNITKGITSLPKAGGTIGGNFYRADCSKLPITIYGNSIVNNTGAPMNMTYRSFNGIDQYITYPDDPTLKYTGDLSISTWLKPLDLGNNVGDTGLWHQIVGKGQIVGGVENDNYQMVAISKQLYFEWTDPNGQHFHIQTNGPALTEGAWQYVTLTVSNGNPKILVNNVEQPFQMYTGNNPNSAGLAPTGQKVNLRDNTLPMSIGKQNAGPPNEFYYQGDIGNMALYNRPLTAAEIQQNLLTYSA